MTASADAGTVLGMGTPERRQFTEEQYAHSLELMRVQCAKALTDQGSMSGPLGIQAGLRAELFAQAAADLSGSSVESELVRASGQEANPHWQLPKAG